MGVKIAIVEKKTTLTSRIGWVLTVCLVLVSFFLNKTSVIFKVNILLMFGLPIFLGIRRFFVKDFIIKGYLFFLDVGIKIIRNNEKEEILLIQDIKLINYSFGDIEFINRFSNGINNFIEVQFGKSLLKFRINLNSVKQEKELKKCLKIWNKKGVKLCKKSF